jgi:hypothetical protein
MHQVDQLDFLSVVAQSLALAHYHYPGLLQFLLAVLGLQPALVLAPLYFLLNLVTLAKLC